MKMEVMEKIHVKNYKKDHMLSRKLTGDNSGNPEYAMKCVNNAACSNLKDRSNGKLFPKSSSSREDIDLDILVENLIQVQRLYPQSGTNDNGLKAEKVANHLVRRQCFI